MYRLMANFRCSITTQNNMDTKLREVQSTSVKSSCIEPGSFAESAC